MYKLVLRAFCFATFRNRIAVGYDTLVVLMLIVVRVYDLIKGVNRHLVSSYVTLMTGVAALVDLARYNIYARFSPRGSAGFTMSTLYIVMVFFVLSLFFDYMSNISAFSVIIRCFINAYFFTLALG